MPFRRHGSINWHSSFIQPYTFPKIWGVSINWINNLSKRGLIFIWIVLNQNQWCDCYYDRYTKENDILLMISNRNDIFRCLIIGSCLFIFWGVIIIWIVSHQNLCHALYLTQYFSKYSGVTIIWNSTLSMPWDVPTNWNMSSNWHQRVPVFVFYWLDLALRLFFQITMS